jgi:histidine triad (HIT) family protein
MRANCVFCDRVRNLDYDTDDRWCVTFEPLNPVVPGHFLVIPKSHAASATADPFLAGKAMRYAAELAYVRGLKNVNFITSAGPVATQTVFHLHVHVVPRREGDGLALPWTGQRKDQPE